MSVHVEMLRDDLEEAVDAFRRTLKRMKHGRVTVTADVLARRVVGHTLVISPLTRDDLEKIMRQRPRPAGKGEGPCAPTSR